MRCVLVICVVCALEQTTSANDFFFVGPQRAEHDDGDGFIDFGGPDGQTDTWFSDTAANWRRSQSDVGPVRGRWIRPAAYEVPNVNDVMEAQPFGEPWIEDEQPEESYVPCACCEPAHKNTGFLDFNTYWDTRDFAVTTVNAGANLKHNFQYFQLLNLDSPIDSGSYDWTSFYTEINLRRPIWKDNDYLKHLDWTAQYADGSTARGVLRFGMRWRFHDTPGSIGCFFKDVLKLKYNVTFHMIETDGTGWQMEHTYRRTFFDKRVYVAAFVDHNINNGGSSTWVTEHQIGVRLFDQWHAVAEYRYKSFAPPGFESGWGLGLEYVMRFE